jgi:hypothetical protein
VRWPLAALVRCVAVRGGDHEGEGRPSPAGAVRECGFWLSAVWRVPVSFLLHLEVCFASHCGALELQSGAGLA